MVKKTILTFERVIIQLNGNVGSSEKSLEKTIRITGQFMQS